MKYIKLFEQYLKENQLKLFPDYEKEHPDNPKEVGMKYLKDREVKHSRQTSTIKTWEMYLNIWMIVIITILLKNVLEIVILIYIISYFFTMNITKVFAYPPKI